MTVYFDWRFSPLKSSYRCMRSRCVSPHDRSHWFLTFSHLLFENRTLKLSRMMGHRDHFDAVKTLWILNGNSVGNKSCKRKHYTTAKHSGYIVRLVNFWLSCSQFALAIFNCFHPKDSFSISWVINLIKQNFSGYLQISLLGCYKDVSALIRTHSVQVNLVIPIHVSYDLIRFKLALGFVIYRKIMNLNKGTNWPGEFKQVSMK